MKIYYMIMITLLALQENIGFATKILLPIKNLGNLY